MIEPIEQYVSLRGRVEAAAIRSGRNPQDVQLLAVSKRQSASAVRQLASFGQRCFGENYVQEAQAKIIELAELKLEWHFIGQLQSNKTPIVSRLFDWVHSIDRLKVAQKLNDQRPDSATPINVCVEVNLSGEASKGGLAPDEIPGFIDSLAGLERLAVRGLMALPAPISDVAGQRDAFRRLHDLLQAIDRSDVSALSMGTSNDFEAAILEGATIVRIGTALFGPRD